MLTVSVVIIIILYWLRNRNEAKLLVDVPCYVALYYFSILSFN